MSTFTAVLPVERLGEMLREGRRLRVVVGLPVGLQGVPAVIDEAHGALPDRREVLLHGHVDDGGDGDLGKIDVVLEHMDP